MKYVTLSYDDNAALDQHFLEIIDRYGAKCTFNLNSGMRVTGKIANKLLGSRKMLSIQDMKTMLAGTDHEIACHGKGHQDLLKMSEEEMKKNLAEDKAFLEDLFARPMQGFAYPFGSYSDATTQTLGDLGFTYARTTVSIKDFSVPEDFLVWHPTCHHNDKELMELAEKFIQIQDDTDHIFYLWGHAWEYGVFKNWERLDQVLSILAKDPTIQYATNQEVVACCLRKRAGVRP